MQKPSITLETPPTSTTTRNVEDSSPSFKLESESPDVLITSPVQSQEQNEPSYVPVANEVNVTSLVEEEESIHIAELDDDIKAMSQEFDEDVRDNLKNREDIRCGRCDAMTPALYHHYACPECKKIKMVCQKCYRGSENCRTHNKKRLLKREHKTWCPKYGMFYTDPNVNTEDNELIRALKQNNTTRIRKYAQNRTLLDSTDRLGFTPLHVAAQLGLEEGTAILIECGALFKTRDRMDHTPLHAAVVANQIKIIQILLDGGADIEQTIGKEGRKAVHLAISRAMYHIVTLLRRRGAEIYSHCDSMPPLCLAIEKAESPKCVEILLAAGANVNDKGRGSPALFYACDIKNHETARIIVDLLLRYGAAVDKPGFWGYTPLMRAAELGHVDVCKSLLEKGAQLEMKTPESWSSNAMYYAVVYGQEEIVDLLIEKGASCVPPKAVARGMNLSFKWNRFVFVSEVTPETRKSILGKLRAAQNKK